MAELAAVAGVAITVPGIVKATWTVLKTAYDLYNGTDMRRHQIRVLLDRSRDLVTKIEQHLSTKENTRLSDGVYDGANELYQACVEIKDVLELLTQKGFLWCLIHQDNIDGRISNAGRRISEALESFHFVAQIQGDMMRRELLQAQKEDREEFVSKLEQLSANDQQILNAIQDQNGVQKRLEDLLVAVLKHVQSLGQQTTPEAKFLKSARNMLQQRSGGRPQDVTADWVVSSLEVDFNPSDIIGQGSFGRVIKAKWTGSRVAVKQMYGDDARTLSKTDRKAMHKEIKLWATLRHPNILVLYGACLEDTLPFLIMQYCPLGNIRQFLQANHDVNRTDLSYDIVAGMHYLHSRDVIHADLKGANIIVDDKHVALVADFGLSLTIDTIRSNAMSTSRASPRGTLRWMAPECLDGLPVSKASDVYGLGMTIWELFSEDIPFGDLRDRFLPYAVIEKRQRPPRPARLESNNVVWVIVQQCWDHEVKKRPSMDAVQKRLEPYTSRLGSLQKVSRHNGKLTSTIPSANEDFSGATVVFLDAKTIAGLLPADVKPCHITDPDALDIDNAHYPVLHVGGFNCWAFSYMDNRYSYALVVYDDKGALHKVIELPGSRYVYELTLANGTATFIGQGNLSASIALSTLQTQITSNSS